MSNIAYLPCAAARPFMRSCSPTFNHTPSPHDHPLPFLKKKVKKEGGKCMVSFLPLSTVAAFSFCPDTLTPRAEVTHAHALNACLQMLMSVSCMHGVMHMRLYAHIHFKSCVRIMHTSAQCAHQMEDGGCSQVPSNASTLAPAPLVGSPGKPAPRIWHAHFMEMVHANRLLHAHVHFSCFLLLTCFCAAIIVPSRQKCDSSLSRIGLLFVLC
jgi:hypothetical protein